VAQEIAKQLAQKFIWIYAERKIPRYTALNRSHPEGFTRERMRGNPDSLFQMIVLAAYDRQPFTIIAKGWEPIWGVASAGLSLPAILRQVSVFDLGNVLSLSYEEIERRLAGCLFFGYRLHSDGAWTRYCKTFKDTADQVNSGLLNMIESAMSSRDVSTIHRQLDRIHGIGPTIASKVVMYTLREVRLGSIHPGELYPAVKPILNEYHNARLVQELEDRYQQPDLVENIFEALKELGDPFAIDALYYVDRDERELREFLGLNEVAGLGSRDSKQIQRVREKQKVKAKQTRSIPEGVLQVVKAEFGNQPFSRRMIQQAFEAAFGPVNPSSFLTADWTVNQKAGYEPHPDSGRWYKRHPILFKRTDGLLELYDPLRRGSWTLVNGRPERFD
jgi:hypothetical protein